MMNFQEMKKLITSENISFFGMILLAFFVLSSKHIIIYNPFFFWNAVIASNIISVIIA